MKQIGFKMKLFAGCADEYKKRHDLIWPELTALLKETGIHDYSIYLSADTNDLFAVLKLENQEKFDALPTSALMHKWWAYMGDIMESNPDGSPVVVNLEPMFYLP